MTLASGLGWELPEHNRLTGGRVQKSIREKKIGCIWAETGWLSTTQLQAIFASNYWVKYEGMGQLSHTLIQCKIMLKQISKINKKTTADIVGAAYGLRVIQLLKPKYTLVHK